MSSEMNLIIGGDGFMGANLRRYFTDRGVPFTEAPAAYKGLRDDKDGNFSVVFDWRNA